MFDNIEDAIANPAKYSINGKQYLLVEFPEHSISQNMKEIFFRLGMAGLTSIITHPERNPVLARHPEKMADWLRSGCYIQITAASLTGRFGKIAQRVSHELLRRNWVNFIATDAHDLTSRPPMLRDAYQLVADKYGVETADRLCRAQSARSLFRRKPAASARTRRPASGTGPQAVLRTAQQDVWLVGEENSRSDGAAWSCCPQQS